MRWMIFIVDMAYKSITVAIKRMMGTPISAGRTSSQTTKKLMIDESRETTNNVRQPLAGAERS